MRVLLAIALLAYPFVVYFFLDRLGPLALAGFFALVTTTRLVLAKHISRNLILLGVAAIVALCLATLWLQNAIAIKLYPVALSSVGALWCAYTLWTPPSAIERLLNIVSQSRAGLPAQMRDRIPFDAQGLSPSLVQRVYMRRLTAVWLVFFLGNGLASAITALLESTATWALYNGLISYLIAGVLLVGEFFYRPYYQRKHEAESP